MAANCKGKGGKGGKGQDKGSGKGYGDAQKLYQKGYSQQGKGAQANAWNGSNWPGSGWYGKASGKGKGMYSMQEEQWPCPWQNDWSGQDNQSPYLFAIAVEPEKPSEESIDGDSMAELVSSSEDEFTAFVV